MPRWNKHCLTIHPISSHDAGIKLSHHIGFLSLHQLMICDLELISTSASQNPINRTSDSASKKRFKMRFSNHRQLLTIGTNGWNDEKHIKQISTTGRLAANRLWGKQQIHTIMYKYHHEGKSAAINKEIARKWRFKALIHAQGGLYQNLPKNGSPKR